MALALEVGHVRRNGVELRVGGVERELAGENIALEERLALAGDLLLKLLQRRDHAHRLGVLQRPHRLAHLRRGLLDGAQHLNDGIQLPLQRLGLSRPLRAHVGNQVRELVGRVVELDRAVAHPLEAEHHLVERGGVAFGRLGGDGDVQTVDQGGELSELLLRRVQHDGLEVVCLGVEQRSDVKYAELLNGVADAPLGEGDDLVATKDAVARGRHVLLNLCRVEARPRPFGRVEDVEVVVGSLPIRTCAAVNKHLVAEQLCEVAGSALWRLAPQRPIKGPVLKASPRLHQGERELLRNTGLLEGSQLCRLQALKVGLRRACSVAELRRAPS